MSIKNLFIFAVLSYLMTACIPSDKTIGDQFIPGDYILDVDTATFNLNLISKRPDSIQSLSSSYMIIGYLADPKFGITTSATAVQILPSDTVDFGDNAEIKSIALRLAVGKNVNYSEKYDGIAQNIYVYKLKSNIDTNTLFNTSFTTEDYDPNPIHLGSPVYYGGATTIEIALSNDFGEELLATTIEEFEDLDLFTKRIKGLYITTDTPSQIKEGGRLNYLTVGGVYGPSGYASGSSIALNYDDTTAYFAVGYNFALNQIKSGSKVPVSNQLEKVIDIEGFSGVKPYLNGRDLKIQLDEWLKVKGYTMNSIILSKASINLPFEMPDDYTDINNQYPKNIYPCIIDSIKYFRPLDDYYYSTNVGAINRSIMLYPCDITMYIQGLIKKDLTQVDSSDDLWFSQILNSPTYNSIGESSTSQSFDYEDFYYGSINGPKAERNPTLSLVFTVLSE